MSEVTSEAIAAAAALELGENDAGAATGRATSEAVGACGCPERDGMTYHERGTCTDPVVEALDWYASTPGGGQ